ncbi:N-acetyltransferase family protein [Rhodopila sp.]|uniref:GNAT family N-acetyltransferase n=1 Tax=Rhodopila sp. TaxID=2480087 RepID=UPI003D136F58
MRPQDLPLLRPLRLEALRRHPSAFGVAFEEEQADDPGRLIGEPPSVTLGGFGGGVLVGSASMVVSQRVKQRHKGHVVAFYVAPAWRRAGLARALLDALVEQARAQGLVLLTLSVTLGNAAARGLYSGAGFSAYGVEPMSLRVGDEFVDAELMALRLDRAAGGTL